MNPHPIAPLGLPDAGLLRFVRDALLPPRFQEGLSADQMRATARLRTFALCTALLIDVAIVLLLNDDPHVRQGPLHFFGVVNIGLLFVDLLLTVTLLPRPHRLWEPVFTSCLLLEVGTTLVWLQLTGSLTSYFFSACVLLILVYRVGFAWRHGVVMAIALAVGHAVVLSLESVGLLAPASLFSDAPGGIYLSPALRAAAACSILPTYFLVLMCANGLVLRLREKDTALAVAQRQLAQMMETVQTGRLSGKLVGEWLLLEVVGTGGMGEVYRAQRLSDRIDAAVKVLHPHLAARPEVLERFRREALVASRLGGCTAAVLEVGTTEAGEPFIASELLRGEDLAHKLRRVGRLPLLEVVSLVAQMARLLEMAHAAGVVHRDIKPSNVFLAQTNGGDVVRLLDFGIAGLLDNHELTSSALVMGSPGYLAPEQARGERDAIGAHSDVFALAAIAYRALTGESAFPARDVVSALYEAVHLTPTPATQMLPNLPADVDDALSLALAKSVSCRTARPQQFAAHLEAAARGELDDDTRARARALAGSVVERTLTEASVARPG